MRRCDLRVHGPEGFCIEFRSDRRWPSGGHLCSVRAGSIRSRHRRCCPRCPFFCAVCIVQRLAVESSARCEVARTGAVPRRTRSRSPAGQERHRHRFRPAEHPGARWPGRRMTGRHRVAEHATGGGQVDDRRQAQLALAGSATGQSYDGDLLRASATPSCATSSGGGPDPQPLPGLAYRSPPRFHTAPWRNSAS